MHKFINWLMSPQAVIQLFVVTLLLFLGMVIAYLARMHIAKYGIFLPPLLVVGFVIFNFIIKGNK